MSYSPGDILFAKYRVEALVGRGAFTEVYRVTYLALDAPRAIKVLRRNTPGLDSATYHDFEERFQLEAQLGAQIRHPHVLQVYDFERDGNTLLLVMEYAAGRSLAQIRHPGKVLPVAGCVYITSQIAEGLGAIHKLGAVHRNIKPGNILFDSQWLAKLSDLGLAQMSGGLSDRSPLSRSAPHPGTLAYISPEQVSFTNCLTPASDVYALGLVLFEMLAGKSYLDQPPGIRLRDLRRDVPEWLEALVARMLAKDPEQRPRDGTEVAERLKGVVERIKVEESEPQRLAVRQQAEAEEQARLKAERAREVAAQDAEEAAAELVRQQAKAVQQMEAEPRQATPSPFLSRLSSSSIKKIPVTIKQWLGRLTLPLLGGLAVLLLLSLGFLGIRALTNDVRPRQAFEAPAGMALIPAGSFTMGGTVNDNEMPAHEVTLDAFYMDVHEVTTAQFAQCVREGQCQPPSCFSDAAHPAICVDWYQAQAFCQWMGARLPTEAEWEYAARGGLVGKRYPWGDKAPVCRTRAANGAKFDDDEGCNDTGTAPVGSFAANGYGLYDMAGNVWEWTSSLYKPYPYDSQDGRNDLSASGSRVLRGGSWFVDSISLRVAGRLEFNPSFKSDVVGFRCAATPLK